MPYSFHTAANNAANGATITISPSANDLIIVFAQTNIGGGSPTVNFSDNSGSSWTTSAVNATAGATFFFSLAYCLVAAGGITTLTGTWNGGKPSTVVMTAVCYSNMNSPTFVGVTGINTQVAPGNAANAIVTNALNVGSSSALFAGFVCDESGNTGFTAGTGFTRRVNNTLSAVDPNADVTGSQIALFTNGTHGVSDTFSSFGIAFTDPPPSNTLLVGQNTPTTGGTGNSSGGSSQIWWVHTGFVA